MSFEIFAQEEIKNTAITTQHINARVHTFIMYHALVEKWLKNVQARIIIFTSNTQQTEITGGTQR